jgi:hypothetical protein
MAWYQQHHEEQCQEKQELQCLELHQTTWSFLTCIKKLWKLPTPVPFEDDVKRPVSLWPSFLWQ